MKGGFRGGDLYSARVPLSMVGRHSTAWCQVVPDTDQKILDRNHNGGHVDRKFYCNLFTDN